MPTGDFGLWAVQALWAEEDPVDDLAGLVRRNLVTRLEGEERWRLHDLLRRFGLAALAADAEREQTLWRRLAPAAVAWLQGIDGRFRSGSDAMVPALAELDQELPLLREVQAWAAERIEGDVVAAGVASELPNYSITQFRLVGDEVLVWRQISLHAAEHRGEKAEIARAAGNLGLVCRHRGDLDRAAEAMQRAADICDELGNQPDLARTLYNLGNVLKDKHDWAGAAEHFRRSLALVEELGMPGAETPRQALAEAEAHLAGRGS